MGIGSVLKEGGILTAGFNMTDSLIRALKLLLKIVKSGFVAVPVLP